MTDQNQGGEMSKFVDLSTREEKEALASWLAETSWRTGGLSRLDFIRAIVARNEEWEFDPDFIALEEEADADGLLEAWNAYPFGS